MFVVLAGASTEVPSGRASAPRLTVIATTSAVDQPDRAVLHGEPDLLRDGVVRVPPVGEEHRDVLAKQVPDVRRHGGIVRRACLVGGGVDGTLPRMEAAPQMDASRPSNLRLVAFVLTAVGALAIGVGSVLTWVSAGFTQPQLAGLTSVTKGLDTTEGKVALGCAVAALIIVVISRVVSDAARAVLAGVLVVVGALAAVVAA